MPDKEFNSKLNFIKKSVDRYFNNKFNNTPYQIGLYNGIEETLAYLEGRRAETKILRPISLWERIKILFTGEL